MNGVLNIMLEIVLVTTLFIACDKKGTPNNDNPDKDSSKKTERAPQLGANFNANLRPDFVRFSELKNSRTTWIRGMIPFFQLYKKYKDGKKWYNDGRILTYRKLQKKGYKTVLAIRYMFRRHNLSIPEKGTTQFKDYMRFTDALLRVLLPSTNIIVPGNEPILAALKKDKKSQRLVVFYEEVAKHTHTYIKKHNLSIPIFIGSFANPYKPVKQNNIPYTDLLTFAKETDWVQGVDIHIHHSDNKQISEAMDYINNRIRPDQYIMISEFSLVAWWGKHRDDNLSAAFTTKYSLPEGVDKVWEYLNYALKNPRPLEEWNDWNKMTSWLESRRHYLCNAWKIFTGYPKFWLAFYSFKLGWPPHFSPTDPAWILNALLVNKTVVHRPDGDAYGRIWYMNDFKAIQNGTQTSCDQ